MKLGETLAGRYELKQVLASGRGTLFLAQDRRADRLVTVKVFDAAHVGAEELQRYAARIAAASTVAHPAVVVPGVQVATSESPPFVVGEVLQGEDLGSLCARLKPVPWARAIAIAHVCADAVAALVTATGAAHRALRPGNVWLSPSGQARVLDFGIAEIGAPPARPRPDGTFVEYRAPEQIEGAPGDARSDVFSLGVLLFEMVTGVHPFSGPSAAAVAIKVLTQAAPTPILLAPRIELPAPLTAVIGRALARRPKDRIPDLSSLARELTALLPPPPQTETPAPARPPEVAAGVPSPEPEYLSSFEPEHGSGGLPLLAGITDLRSRQRRDFSPSAELTPSLPVRNNAGFTADERTEVLPRREEPQASTAVERTEVLPPSEESRVSTAVERTEVLPRREESRVSTAVERTEVLPRSEESRAESSDERTHVLPRVTRPPVAALGERSAPPEHELDDARTQALPRFFRPAVQAGEDDARTQPMRRSERPQREPSLDEERTQVLSRTDAGALWPGAGTPAQHRAADASTDTEVPADVRRTPESSPSEPQPEAAVQRGPRVAPSTAEAVGGARPLSPRRSLIALNLALGLLIVVGVLWLWLRR